MSRAIALLPFLFAVMFCVSCSEPSPDVPGEGQDTPPVASEPVASDPKTLDGILDRLDVGQLVFGAPKKMEIGEAKVVKFVLSKTKSVSELKREMDEEFQGNAVLEGHKIKIADTMVAHLTGSDFEITKINGSEEQSVSRRKTEWDWEVKAKKSGKCLLNLSVDALVSVDGKEKENHHIRTFSEEIDVAVAPVSWNTSVSNFVGKNWQWLWSVVVVPLAGWIWHRQRKA